MADQFRIADLDLYSVGDGQYLVRRKAGGAPLFLPEGDARLLASCGSYRSIEDHAQAWAAQVERAKVKQAKQQAPRWLARMLDAGPDAAQPSAKVAHHAELQLRNFAEKGLLSSQSSFLSEITAATAGEPSDPIHSLGFTTRRRTPELRRALESYAANFARHGRSPEIHIVEDSRDPKAEAETQQLLLDFQSASGLPVRFAGLAERESFAAELAREACAPLNLVRFALLGDMRCPVTTGSARNTLLLDCVSTRFVLADDDGLCRMARAPEACEGLELSSQNDPTQFWFFENRDALLEQLDFTEEPDLFAVHETLLGRPLACAVEDVGLDLGGASPALEGRLRRLGGSVRTTMAGVVGDSGVASTAYLHAEPRTLARLTASESFYHAVVSSRQVLRAPQTTTASEGFLTMAGNLGIDAASLFPPFAPVQRNSDGILGRLLQQCFPASCRGYLNWAVLHDPIQARSQSLEDWFDEIRRIRFADVLSAVLRDSADAALDDPSESLQALGDRLMSLARVRPETFREELRSKLIAREAARIAQLRSAPEDTPAFYRDLQTRYIAVIQEALVEDAYLHPRDLPEGSLALAQELVGKLGAMLNAWPRLWNASLWMRGNGRRLSRVCVKA